MQATVARFDPDSREGTVVLDDGHEIPFPGHVFDASALRLLRPGQRLTISVQDGAVTALGIVGIGEDATIR